MRYVCLGCGRRATADAPPACPSDTCTAAMLPAKDWSRDKPDGAKEVKDFNPSCRNVAFDIFVDVDARRVHVVVHVKLNFTQGNGAPAWTNDTKARFRELLAASVSLWDGKATFTHSGNSYTPSFYIDERGSKQATLTVTSANEPQRIEGTLLLQNNAYVVLAGDYGDHRPMAKKGTRHDLQVGILSITPRTYILDTNLEADAQVHFNAFAHEFGHLIGLPDEYDAFDFGTGTLYHGKVSRDLLRDPKSKTVAFWVELLAQHGLESPTWGHDADMSLMRNVDTRATSFKPRHFVTVLEGLNYLSAFDSTLAGPWDVG